MSSLLEQAIVDAKALKEAALKNAEHAIIEKYAPDIKSAVRTLLEQDELEFEDEEAGDFPPEMALGDEEAPEEEPYIPAAATDGERLCPCPEDEQEIEIDFEDLRAAVMEGEKALGIMRKAIAEGGGRGGRGRGPDFRPRGPRWARLGQRRGRGAGAADGGHWRRRHRRWRHRR